MAHNATQVPFRDWCPFCVASRGRSSPHRRVVVKKTTDTLSKFQTDYMFTRTVAESKNSAMHHIRGNAQWSGDQLHVRSDRELRGIDEGNPATFWSSRFLQSSHPSRRQRDDIIDACRKVARERARTHSGTRTMLTNTGIQLSAISLAIPLRWMICARMNTRWRRNIVCLRADQFAESLL